MPKQVHVLDDIQLRAWVAKGEPVARSDGDGLTFTLSKAGTASWILRYRLGGTTRREMTLGNYPDMSLAAARKLARQHRVGIDGGGDPAREKRIKKARAAADWTVTLLIDDYNEKIMPSLAKGSAGARKRHFKNVIRPTLGPLSVSTVTAADIVLMVERVRSWSMAEQILCSASRLFYHAVGRRLINANPCAGISLDAIKGAKPAPRKRVMLTPGELHEILSKVDTAGRKYGLILRCLFGTCVRTAEFVKSRKEHFDLDNGTWWVVPENVKTRHGMLVPLSPAVTEWIQELMDMSGDSEYLLPGMYTRDGSHMGVTTLWDVLSALQEDKAFNTRYFTPHDTRSTAKGHMRNLGVSNEISELALNHKRRGIEGIYDVREEVPELRVALELWSDFLIRCERGITNVVPIAAARA
ncbi:tyrosine-type recombinase/integrase [Paraburkholderia sp. MM5477-R1]|uniref:tyrosine-type recombinase/integrase n=1 Tax=Paraburkholderia sp. MM5477-R1 TaxID=2991062 RepID=UPI003D1AA75B